MTTQIGRKIYYELSTGNAILDTGERQGDVVETTEAQDFALYSALAPYQQSAVGVLQLTFGQDAANFVTYPYRVDITQTPPVIVWDTANPIGASLADVQTAKVAQLRDMFTQTLVAGFLSSADGTSRTYGYTPTNYDHSDQSNMNKIATQSALGLTVWPVDYADIHGSPVPLTQVQFTQLVSDAGKFELAQTTQLRSLIGQVQQATTIDVANAVQWTAASY